MMDCEPWIMDIPRTHIIIVHIPLISLAIVARIGLVWKGDGQVEYNAIWVDIFKVGYDYG